MSSLVSRKERSTSKVSHKDYLNQQARVWPGSNIQGCWGLRNCVQISMWPFQAVETTSLDPHVQSVRNRGTRPQQVVSKLQMDSWRRFLAVGTITVILILGYLVSLYYLEYFSLLKYNKFENVKIRFILFIYRLFSMHRLLNRGWVNCVSLWFGDRFFLKLFFLYKILLSTVSRKTIMGLHSAAHKCTREWEAQ